MRLLNEIQYTCYALFSFSSFSLFERRTDIFIGMHFSSFSMNAHRTHSRNSFHDDLFFHLQ